MINLFHPFIPLKEALAELKDTLSGKWIGQAHKVELFEKQFSEKFGYKNALFTNSCTSALELSYHLIGLGKGDEVIVPILDCTAGQMGLLRRGVKIVFADIEQNLNISPNDLEKKITKKTKAIIAVHLGGIPFSNEVFDIAKKYKIPLIVDCAQHLAHSEGDYVCYSFQAIKHITTGDGGMLIVKDKKQHERAKKLRWFGIDRELKAKKDWQAWDRRQMTFDIEEAGYKFQPTDIDACLGLVGLKHADRIIKERQELCEEYKRNLPDVTLLYGGTCWILGIICRDRDKVAAHLKKNGIETNLVHLRNDIFKIFGGKRQNLKRMNFMEDKYLYLPLHNHLTKKDVKFICRKLLEVY